MSLRRLKQRTARDTALWLLAITLPLYGALKLYQFRNNGETSEYALGLVFVVTGSGMFGKLLSPTQTLSTAAATRRSFRRGKGIRISK
jgi:hypothetical protein